MMLTICSAVNRRQNRKCLAVLVTVLALPWVAQAQGRAQQLFEAGQDEAALAAAAEAPGDPAGAFLAGQVRLRMNQPAEAAQEFQRIAEQGDPVWQAVGQSGAALASGDLHGALDAGTRAVGANPGSFHANYQLGLVKAKMNDWAGAAEAFGRAAEIDPNFAYAHYYAGIANSRIKRADLTAVHLETFLKLAPMAPERPAMESLMRTLRGR
jgi:tetratricopeptide (TPR) repeat protein